MAHAPGAQCWSWGGEVRSAGLLAQQRLRRGVDPAPDVPASGKTGELGEFGILSRIGLQKDIIQSTPRTPEDMGPVREKHRQRTGPGEITKHWGLKDTPFPGPGKGYGVKTYQGESVAENFKAGQVLGMAEYLLSRGEAVYHSSKREPLGKGWVRGHKLPPHTQDPAFEGFGRRTQFAGNSKESMYPRDTEPESEVAHAQYCKTHGSFEAGEQLKRNYRWPKGVGGNPNFRFGITDEVDSSRGNGAKRALTMDSGLEPHAVEATVIGKYMHQIKRNVTHDHLGVGRVSMQGPLPVPPDHAFGVRTDKHGPDVGSLIRGNYSPEEQQPDADLGTCLMPGRRNYHSDEPFGLPSVRTDLLHRVPRPEHRPVVNSTNFGDDPDSVDLIYPPKFHHMGLSDEDFSQRREPAELQSLLAGAGYNLDPGHFNSVFQEAVGFYGDNEPAASVEAMLVAYFNVTGPAPLQGRHHP